MAKITVFLLLLAGIIEAAVCWLQLFGVIPSGHPGYGATGTFYNPGPCCAFLGFICPAALWCALDKERAMLIVTARIFFLVAIPLLPSLMGRTGWVAAIIGSLWVLYISGRLRIRTGHMRLIAIGVVIIMAIGLFLIKPASAMGRILMWRLGFKAMMQSPINGVGWNKVAGAIGQAQENYFQKNPDSVFSSVASTPDFAFNEYLQLGIAFGIPAMLMLTALLIFAVRSAWKSGHYGLSGSVLAFMVVCLWSYPFQFPEFIICSALAVTGSLLGDTSTYVWTRRGICLGIAIVTLTSLIGITGRKRQYEKWIRKRTICQHQLDDEKISILDSLMKLNCELPAFLFDYGKSLREAGLFEKSNKVLNQGLAVSADPMFLNLIGRNFQDMGHHDEAALYFRRSIHRLPQRLYPYYLLCKLYSDSTHSNRANFINIYREAMELKPKVMSPAISEMWEDMDRIHKDFQL